MAESESESFHFLSETGGLIDSLAICMPPDMLQGQEAKHIARRRALGNLAASFPPAVTLVILTSVGKHKQTEDWVKSSKVACKIEIASVMPSEAQTKDYGLWIQDAFHVLSNGSRRKYLVTASDRLADHATWLSSHDGTPVETSKEFLAGGNLLKTGDRRIAGHNSISSAAAFAAVYNLDPTASLFRYGYNDADPGISGGRLQDALQRISYRTRYPIIPPERAGAPFPSLLRRVVAATLAELRKAGTVRDRSETTAQFDFHVDLLVSVTGCCPNGRPVVLVGEPVEASLPGKKPDDLPIARWIGRMKAAAARLESAGFEVRRNPVPYRNGPLFGQYAGRFYNNVLLENEARAPGGKPQVWLPLYGVEEKDLGTFDERNADIWKDLGFDIRPVTGWGYLAEANGALRCASKVLARRPAGAGGNTLMP